MSPVALAALPTSEALDRVRDALDGAGDSLLPVADGAATRGLHALAPGTPLLDGEDDESDPTALVVATSGSTGEPKGALLPASALRASASATHDRLGSPGTWLLALAPHHIAGVQVLVRSVLAGTEPEVLDLRSGFDEQGFADASDRLRGRTSGRRYTALVPTQLARLLDAGGRAADALAAFDAVLLGGAATPPSLLARARDAGIRVVTTYGMSETCGGCVYDGVPLDGVHVAVEGSGRVALGGQVIARGYRLRPDDHAFTLCDGARWFITNDLGARDGDGRLTVLGRADDVIVTGGTNVAPQSVEAVISELDGVRECLVVGVPDARWGQRVVALLIVSRADGSPVPDAAPPGLDAVRHLVKARLGAAAAPRDVLLVDTLPATTPGKPDRRTATRLAQSLLSRAASEGRG